MFDIHPRLTIFEFLELSSAASDQLRNHPEDDLPDTPKLNQ